MDADGHEKEVEVGEVLDEFSAFGKDVFAKFRCMKPQK